MSDRTYFYKHKEIGNWNVNIEGLTVPGDPAIFHDTSYSGTNAVTEKGAASHYSVEAKVRLQKSDPNVGTETYDAFFKRRVQFAIDVKTLKGVAGHLVVVSDRSTQRTTTTSSAAIGAPATIPVTAMIGLAVGDLALIINSSTSLHEVVTISGVNTTALTYEATTTIAVNSGGVVANLAWYLPNCYLMGDVSVSGQDGQGSNITEDITVTFQGVDDPTFQT